MVVNLTTSNGATSNFFWFQFVLKAKKKGGNMKEPSGKDLLAILIKLLGEQENVKIKCEIKEGAKENGA